MRSSNGLKFNQKSIEKFWIDLEKKIQWSSTYTPEKVRASDNFNEVAMNVVQAMLQDSGLKLTFWGEALLTFVHTKNKTEHSFTECLTPQELWSGFKPR